MHLKISSQNTITAGLQPITTPVLRYNCQNTAGAEIVCKNSYRQIAGSYKPGADSYAIAERRTAFPMFIYNIK